MKTNFISAFMLFIVLAGVSLKISAQSRYNVIFIVVDDMNDKVPFLGYPEVLTPNLQRLLSRGMAFTSAYCQFPLCNPSRVSMMSGWRPNKTNVYGNGADPAKLVPSDVKYLQDYLHSFGYRTERYGKIYHGQFEYEFNWDYAEDDKYTAGLAKSFVTGLAENSSDPGSWGITRKTDSGTEYKYVTDLVKSLQSKGPEPGFYALGLEVHNPFTPNLANWNKYGTPSVQVDLPVWQTTATVKGNIANNIIVPNTPANDRDDAPAVAFWANKSVVKDDSEWRKTVQAYYSEVSTMDRNIGLVFDEMDRDNLWANTIVVFISDHGQHLGEHGGLWLKNTLFKESLHIPLIVYAPGKASGICSKLVETVDVYPTITELCRVPTPASVEGSSMARLMNDPSQQWKNAVFSELKVDSTFPLVDKAEAVHTQNYHYNNWGEYGEELYDLQNDPNEYTNQANNPAYAAPLDQVRLIYQNGWQNSRPPSCDSVTYYLDNDRDGYGSNDSIFKGCYQPIKYVIAGNDCNDSDSNINPGAIEICDGKDNNCNGLIDEPCIPKLSISDKSIIEGNAGTKTQWFTIGMSQPSSNTISFNFSTSDSTALSGSDFINVSKTVKILPGQTSKKVSVSIIGDIIPEKNEYFKVTLSDPKNALIEVASANGIIKNDDGSIAISTATDESSLKNSKVPAGKKYAEIWPNPAANTLSLQFKNSVSGIAKIEIINLTGIKVSEWILNSYEHKTVQLNLANINNGVYFLLISDAKGNQQKEKIIIQH